MTIGVADTPRRGTLSRSSSYSLSSATSTATPSRDPMNRIRDYSARSTDSVFPSPNFLVTSVYSPPPNTPATFEPIFHDYSKTEFFPDGITFGSEEKDNDAYNPFSYSGPTQYPNHTSQAPTLSNGVPQDRQIAGERSNYAASQASGPGIADLEKARGSRGPDRPKTKRSCARKALIVCAVFVLLFVLGIVAVVVVIIKLRHRHDKHHRRGIYQISPHVGGFESV